MIIRIASNQDRDHIKEIHLCAFPEEEGEIISKLAIDLLSEKTTPQTISLVAEVEGSIVGHIVFSPVTIDNSDDFQGYILAPLGVKPDFQKRGIGSKLIEYGLHMLSTAGVHIVFVYGDPKYYGKFGFSADTAHPYSTPYKLEYPFGWQAITLNKCDYKKTPASISCVAPLCDQQLW